MRGPIFIAASAIVVGAWACEADDPASEPPGSAPAPEAGSDDPLATLPDPLRFEDGRRVGTKEEWPARRAEILELFAKHVYGRPPAKPDALDFAVVEENATAMDGVATLRRIDIHSTVQGREHRFGLTLFVPNAVARSGVFVLISTRPKSHTDPTRAEKSEYWPAEDVIARGWAIAAIDADELAPDDKATFMNGVIRLFEGDAAAGPRAPDAYKAIGAWSWGAMRAVDYLVTDSKIDPSRIAIVGHSRSGKAALWAGAQDERIALTVSNDSGCAGAALSRRPVGENVALVTDVYPYWFSDVFATYANRDAELPVDQHELIALLAPRAVAVGSASEDNWADPEGEFLGLARASSVYSLFGFAPIADASWPKPDAFLFTAPRNYHLRVGGHELTKYDWDRYVDAAERVWPN